MRQRELKVKLLSELSIYVPSCFIRGMAKLYSHKFVDNTTNCIGSVTNKMKRKKITK